MTKKAAAPAKVVLSETAKPDLEACHKLDVDAGVAPWPYKRWLKEWSNDSLRGITARQRLGKHKLPHVVGYVLYREFGDGVDIERFAVHPYADKTVVGSALLKKFYGLVRVVVRERDVPLCNLLKANGFKAVKVQRRAFTAPEDDGYWFHRGDEPQDEGGHDVAENG